jgi:antimicrobial peptide system SdpB family protein
MNWNKLDNNIENLLRINPWTNVYGLSRSILALSTLLTFGVNDIDTIFRPILGFDQVPICQGFAKSFSLFCLFPDNLLLGKIIAMTILFLVVIGIYPRFTGVLHWWVNYSFITSSPLVDGGEHAAAVLSLLMIPLTLTDGRRWHWQTLDISHESGLWSKTKQLIGLSAHQIVRIQVAVIYLHAAVAKCSVPEWQNGTAIYYWFSDEMFGLADWLKPIIGPVIENGYTLPLLTWSIIVLEFLLFAGLFMHRHKRMYVLALGLLFHFFIGLVHGLISFALIMTAALIIFLYPIDRPLGLSFKFRFKIPWVGVPVKTGELVKQ